MSIRVASVCSGSKASSLSVHITENAKGKSSCQTSNPHLSQTLLRFEFFASMWAARLLRWWGKVGISSGSQAAQKIRDTGWMTHSYGLELQLIEIAGILLLTERFLFEVRTLQTIFGSRSAWGKQTRSSYYLICVMCTIAFIHPTNFSQRTTRWGHLMCQNIHLNYTQKHFNNVQRTSNALVSMCLGYSRIHLQQGLINTVTL